MKDKETKLGNTSVVSKYRRQYPTPMSEDQIVSLLRQVAGEVKGGILRKPDGNNCNGYSCDIICFSNNELYDVLVDTENMATPSWSRTDNPRGYQCEMVIPTPPIDPIDPGVPEESLLLRILVVLEQIQKDQATQTESLNKAIADLRAQVAAGVPIKFR